MSTWQNTVYRVIIDNLIISIESLEHQAKERLKSDPGGGLEYHKNSLLRELISRAYDQGKKDK